MKRIILVAAVLAASPAWAITIEADSYGQLSVGDIHITWHVLTPYHPSIGELAHSSHRGFLLFGLPQDLGEFTDAYLLLPQGSMPPGWPLIANQAGESAEVDPKNWAPG